MRLLHDYRSKIFAALTLVCVLAVVGAAIAQDRISADPFGKWVVLCRADGMTDRTSCSLSNVVELPGLSGGAVLLEWSEARPESGLRITFHRRRPEGTPYLRVGRGAPAALAVCGPGGFDCMAFPSEDARLAREIAAGARTALLRIGSLESGVDVTFDLSNFAQAREALLLKRQAAGQPIPSRPVDALERLAVMRAEASAPARRFEQASAANAPRRAQFCTMQPTQSQAQACTATAPQCVAHEPNADLRAWAACIDDALEPARAIELQAIARNQCAARTDMPVGDCQARALRCRQAPGGWRGHAECLRREGLSAIPIWAVPSFTN